MSETAGEPATKKTRMEEGEEKKKAPGTAGVLSHPADAYVGQTVQEGAAVVERAPGDTGAFYNPIQEFNRDVSVAALSVFAAEVREWTAAAAAAATPAERAAAKAAARARRGGMVPCAGHAGGVRVLEGLAATGLRSVRYAKEVPGVVEVVANDMAAAAVASIARAAARNGVADVVRPSQGDAAFVLQRAASTGRAADLFDVVDLDPYGSPAPFLDGAVQAVADGGLLCVTFTDMAVLCGAHADACFSKYDCVPLHKAHYCHELALRIGVTAVARAAARHRRYVQPLLCIAVDYYMRLFLRVATAPREANRLPARLAHIAQCVRCDAYHTIPVATVPDAGKGAGPLQPGRWTGPAACAACGGALMLGGPVWAAPLCDAAWVRAVLAHVDAQPAAVFPHTRARIRAVLGAVLDEVADAPPLFLALDALCHTLRVSMPPRAVVEHVFRAAGYRLSVSHTNPQALKTDAPQAFVWALLKQWAVVGRGIVRPLPPDSLAATIFARTPDDPRIDLDAAEKAPRAHDAHRTREKRFLPNPAPHWGPASRAGRKTTPSEKAERKRQHRALQKEAQQSSGNSGDDASQTAPASADSQE